MYERPENKDVYDRYWTILRKELGTGPAELSRDADLWQLWQNPELLIGQTCGLPYRSKLHKSAHLVATPDYGVRGCPKGYYRSCIIARPGQSVDELDGKRFAYNDAVSESGWGAPHRFLTSIKVTPSVFVQTGAHQESAVAVAEGRADFASIDAVTWRQMRHYDRFTDDLEVIAQTKPSPSLPLITAKPDLINDLRGALNASLELLGTEDRDILGVRKFVIIPQKEYLSLPIPPIPSAWI